MLYVHTTIMFVVCCGPSMFDHYHGHEWLEKCLPNSLIDLLFRIEFHPDPSSPTKCSGDNQLSSNDNYQVRSSYTTVVILLLHIIFTTRVNGKISIMLFLPLNSFKILFFSVIVWNICCCKYYICAVRRVSNECYYFVCLLTWVFVNISSTDIFVPSGTCLLILHEVDASYLQLEH